MSKQLRVYREGTKTEFDYQILWEEDFTKLADAVEETGAFLWQDLHCSR